MTGCSDHEEETEIENVNSYDNEESDVGTPGESSDSELSDFTNDKNEDRGCHCIQQIRGGITNEH